MRLERRLEVRSCTGKGYIRKRDGRWPVRERCLPEEDVRVPTGDTGRRKFG
ncbi:hypothetical protein Hanom_Chr12g01072851 [Helianthus anomalus]